jgi:hypothetical protein
VSIHGLVKLVEISYWLPSLHFTTANTWCMGKILSLHCTLFTISRLLSPSLPILLLTTGSLPLLHQCLMPGLAGNHADPCIQGSHLMNSGSSAVFHCLQQALPNPKANIGTNGKLTQMCSNGQRPSWNYWLNK